MDTTRTPEAVLAEIAGITTMERGTMCKMHASSGRVYHNLQFWSNGRNRCEYVPDASLELVREAVENYRRYRRLADEYAATVESRTRRARRRGEDSAEKKGYATRRHRLPKGRSRPSSTG